MKYIIYFMKSLSEIFYLKHDLSPPLDIEWCPPKRGGAWRIGIELDCLTSHGGVPGWNPADPTWVF